MDRKEERRVRFGPNLLADSPECQIKYHQSEKDFDLSQRDHKGCSYCNSPSPSFMISSQQTDPLRLRGGKEKVILSQYVMIDRNAG